jgi:hypothetical protein
VAERIETPEQQLRTLDRLTPLARQHDLYLAGGTAVAIHLGHRVSRDLDLFGRKPNLELELLRADIVRYGDAEVVSMTDATLHVRLGGVPVDLVKYPYAPLHEPGMGPGQFPLASLEDLATMKLSAISRRGIRRDFWDLHEMATRGGLTLESALSAYSRRYGASESDLYHVLRSLTYFDDAEADALRPRGMSEAKWREIKTWCSDHVPELLRAALRRE